MLHDEMHGGVNLRGWAGHAAPERVVSIPEERALGEKVNDLLPDSGASGERGVAPHDAHQMRKQRDGGDSSAPGGEGYGHSEHRTQARARAAREEEHEAEKTHRGFDHPRAAGSAHDEDEGEEDEGGDAG